jgi:hypothetical protein
MHENHQFLDQSEMKGWTEAISGGQKDHTFEPGGDVFEKRLKAKAL